ncbi:xylosyltransferase 2-like [Hibiscus syriacus]|uniref:Xylosyltransferase 2-like n=1 Tax=Hibiscus syriacus TaxID=106335 RepID=A0A6A3CP47_HIBSY|nr:xylosyltransferase 2-like [Hibiscus syriacus]
MEIFTKAKVVKLRSHLEKYLVADDDQETVLQTVPDKMDWKLQWEPIRDGFQIKFKTWSGKFLRANGGTPPGGGSGARVGVGPQSPTSVVSSFKSSRFSMISTGSPMLSPTEVRTVL